MVLHRADLQPDEVHGIVTSPEHTLLQCFRTMPFDEALAAGDSALRHGVPPSVLRRISATVRGPGSQQVRRVCAEANGLADNPFESALRAIALEVPGLQVQPQRYVADGVRPDLVDVELRIVLEADSFAWHGNRGALRRDARRYNLMVVDGWIVLRFSWEDVMHEPDYVRQVLLQAVAVAQGQVEGDCPRCGVA